MGCNLRSIHASAPGEIRISSQDLRNCAGYFGSKLFQQVIVAGAILLFYRGAKAGSSQALRTQCPGFGGLNAPAGCFERVRSYSAGVLQPAGKK
jgi:hypothetical protein